jgi:hypothetical protein
LKIIKRSFSKSSDADSDWNRAIHRPVLENRTPAIHKLHNFQPSFSAIIIYFVRRKAQVYRTSRSTTMFRSIFLASLFYYSSSSSFGVVDAAADSCNIDLGSGVALQHSANSDAGTFTMTLTYTGGRSWIGIGINERGRNKMTPSNAVIGRAESDDGSTTTSVLKYSLSSDSKDGSGVNPMVSQTLQNASFVQTDTTSTLTFTQLLNEPEQVVSDTSAWIFAVGLADNRWAGQHKIRGSFQFSLAACDIGTALGSSELLNSGSSSSTIVVFADTTKPTHSLWKAHGLLLAIAWGVCAPIGIGASLLRSALVKVYPANKGLWFQIHKYMNTLTVVLTCLGFLIAVVAIHKEGGQHFDETHHKVGLSIFLLVIVQAVAGYFRAALPPKADPPQKKGEDATEDDDKFISMDSGVADIELVLDPTTGGTSVPITSSSDSIKSTAMLSSNEELVKMPPKSRQRVAWEYGHRLLGMTLLGLAWYNCDSGIDWLVQNFQDQKDLTGAFWGVTAGLSGTIVLLAFLVRL